MHLRNRVSLMAMAMFIVLTITYLISLGAYSVTAWICGAEVELFTSIIIWVSSLVVVGLIMWKTRGKYNG